MCGHQGSGGLGRWARVKGPRGATPLQGAGMVVGRRAGGLKLAPVHAPGQAGHGPCQERLVLLLVVHMCCGLCLSPPNPAGERSTNKPGGSTQGDPRGSVHGSREQKSPGTHVLGWELPSHGRGQPGGPLQYQTSLCRPGVRPLAQAGLLKLGSDVESHVPKKTLCV